MHHDWGIIWHLFRGFSKKNLEIEKIKSIHTRASITVHNTVIYKYISNAYLSIYTVILYNINHEI